MCANLHDRPAGRCLNESPSEKEGKFPVPTTPRPVKFPPQ